MTNCIVVENEENIKRVSCGCDMIECEWDFRLKLSDVEGLKLLSEG